MSSTLTIKGKKTRRGICMRTGKGWRLINVKGRNEFVGALLHTINLGDKRLAIFSVWKG